MNNNNNLFKDAPIIVENPELKAASEIKTTAQPTEQQPRSNHNSNFKPRERNNFRKRNFEEEDLKSSVVKIKRVTKVVKGGRRFRFSALVIVGDEKGRVGFGKGKANEVPDAIRKAKKTAQKNMFRINMTKKGTIVHDVIGKFGATSVLMKPSKKESGIVAGGAVRLFLETAGVKNIYTKVFGARNSMNMVRAVVNGFKKSTTWKQVSINRGLNNHFTKREQDRNNPENPHINKHQEASLKQNHNNQERQQNITNDKQ